MPLIQTDSQHYSDIADAIRDMSGNEETFYPSEMAAGVRSIPQTIAIAPIIYSLEEREIGVWTDGKPLYEKSFEQSITLINIITDTATVDIPTNISNFGDLVNIQGAMKCSNSVTSQVFPLYINGDVNTRDKIEFRYLFTSDGVTKMRFIIGANYTGGWTNPAILKVTIQYTKTTDTPGSGTWTPSGVPAHHYSTEEQVIGTWIDGKPLYEKTIIFDTVMSLQSNTWTNTSLDASFIKGIIDCKGYAENMIPNAGLLASKSTNNFIQLLNLRSSSINCRGFTLQYTKTTD